MRLFAVRGAAGVARNDAESIVASTEELMTAIMERNALVPADVVSCLFTLTEDLDAQFPALAARRMGFDQVPLLCAREIPVPGSLPSVVRVLAHFHAADEHRTQHVYLGTAAALREDLRSAQ